MKNNRIYVEKIVNQLKKENKTISFAESCTGGRLASEFTAISGVSDVFNGSCVTYSNEIKEEWLGVEKKVLEKFGAVSKECVNQMLSGITTLSKSDYAIAISGVAGPLGGTDIKPVGTVYIGLQTPFSQELIHCFFNGNREDIQNQATIFAIEKLGDFLDI